MYAIGNLRCCLELGSHNTISNRTNDRDRLNQLSVPLGRREIDVTSSRCARCCCEPSKLRNSCALWPTLMIHGENLKWVSISYSIRGCPIPCFCVGYGTGKNTDGGALQPAAGFQLACEAEILQPSAASPKTQSRRVKADVSAGIENNISYFRPIPNPRESG